MGSFLLLLRIHFRMSLKILIFIFSYIEVLSVEALSCPYQSPTTKICNSREIGTVELLTVQEMNPVSGWSTKNRDTYKIKVKYAYSRSVYQDKLDDIIIIDCNRKFDCNPGITVGKTYVLATRIKHDKDNDKRARKIRGLCGTWYMDFNELSYKQEKWLNEVHENCKNCIPSTKNKCIPFPYSENGSSHSGKGSIQVLIIIVVVLFVAALALGADIYWNRRNSGKSGNIV